MIEKRKEIVFLFGFRSVNVQFSLVNVKPLLLLHCLANCPENTWQRWLNKFVVDFIELVNALFPQENAGI